MTKPFKSLLCILTITMFFIFAVASSSNGVNKMTFTKDGGQIPPDFGKLDDTLLVIIAGGPIVPFGYNHFLKTNFKEHYFGSYKFITIKELNNYPVEQYRFVFGNNENLTSKTTAYTHESATPREAQFNTPNANSTSHLTTTIYYETYEVIDRKYEKTYKTESSQFGKQLIQAYLKSLNDARKK